MEGVTVIIFCIDGRGIINYNDIQRFWEGCSLKWKIEKKYLRIGLIALIVIILAILFNYILEHETQFSEFKAVVRGTLWPIIVGSVLAYLLNPILKLFENYCFRPISKVLFPGRIKKKSKRAFQEAWGFYAQKFYFW